MVAKRPALNEIQAALYREAGSIVRAARALGVHPDTVRRTLRANNAHDLPERVAKEVRERFRIVPRP